MQRAQTVMRFVLPLPSVARTVWRFGRKRRFVMPVVWRPMPPLYFGEPLRTTTLPTEGPLPQLVGLAGLPLDVCEGVVERGGKTAERFAAGRLRGGRRGRLACGLCLEGLDFVLGHRHRADGEADAALCAVNLDDPGLDLLADVESVLDLLDALVGDLGDVDETVNAVLELDERAERGDLGDLALDDHADRVLGGDPSTDRSGPA